MGDGSVENYHHPSSEGTFRVPAPKTIPNSPVGWPTGISLISRRLPQIPA